MKSKAAIITYFGLMLINLYFGIMTVNWLFTIALGMIGTALLMVYFYFARKQDAVLERTWRSFEESWPDMRLWQRATVSFLFPIVFMLQMAAVIADNNLDKRKDRNNGSNNTSH